MHSIYPNCQVGNNWNIGRPATDIELHEYSKMSSCQKYFDIA